jgi:hypothetical protein
LEQPNLGVHFPFYEAIQTAMISLFGKKDYENVSPEMKLKMKYGFDGKRSHSIYRHNDSIGTNNIVLTVFCPLSITCSKEEKVWEELSPNILETK